MNSVFSNANILSMHTLKTENRSAAGQVFSQRNSPCDAAADLEKIPAFACFSAKTGILCIYTPYIQAIVYFMRYFFRNYAKYRDFTIYSALFFLWITAILLYVNTLVWLTFVCLNCIIECKLVHLRMIPVGVFFLCTGSCIHHAAVRSGSDSCHILRRKF